MEVETACGIAKFKASVPTRLRSRQGYKTHLLPGFSVHGSLHISYLHRADVLRLCLLKRKRIPRVHETWTFKPCTCFTSVNNS